MLAMLETASFWVDVLKILVIDLLLSGDNAIMIALVCRNLPPHQRKQAIVLGVGCAIGLRVLLTFFAASLLSQPLVKAVGAILLLWVGVRLIAPKQAHDTGGVKASQHLPQALWTIIAADLVMSLDNILGVAAAAHGSILLLVIGLLASIPLVVMSSQWLLKLIDRLPAIIYAGAGLLGYVSGEMLQTDVLLRQMPHTINRLLPVISAALVIALGAWQKTRRQAKEKLYATQIEKH